MPDLAPSLDVLQPRVDDAALGEDDRAVGEDPRVVGVVVALVVAQVLLRPSRAVVVGLADVEVAALRPVPGDVDVLPGRAHGDLGLVRPGHVAVDVHRFGPVLPVIDGFCEHGREPVVAVPVQEGGVDRAGVWHDLDGRVVLRLRAGALAERDLRAPACAAVPRDGERDERGWTLCSAIPCPVASREEIDVRRRRIGCDRGLPVVEGRAQNARSDPAGCRSGRGGDLGAELAGRLGRLERLEARGGHLGLFLGLLDPGPCAAFLVSFRLRHGLWLGPLVLRVRGADDDGAHEERQADDDPGKKVTPCSRHGRLAPLPRTDPTLDRTTRPKKCQ
jgi:hypothetical protein